MRESTEKQPIKKEESLLDERDFQRFIELRKIAPEDFAIIEMFSRYPKRFFIDFHNFFTSNRELSVSYLERRFKHYKEELERVKDDEEKNRLRQQIEFGQLYLQFLQKYDWTAAWHLNSIFERRKK